MKAFILVLLAASLASAQSAWLTSSQTDSNNAQGRETLTLRGSYLSGSIVRPNVTLVCQNGKLLSSSFNTLLLTRGVRIARDKMAVAIRVGEKKPEYKDWKVAAGFSTLHPDSRFVKKLITAERVDVEFSPRSSVRMTAKFEPSPEDAPRVMRACGIR